MKQRTVIYFYFAVLMCEAFAEKKQQKIIFENDVSRNDFNKSDSISSSSKEDSSSTYHKSVTSISENQEGKNTDLYEIFDDLRTKNTDIDPEIFRDDFNSQVVFDRQKGQLNFKRDDFYNRPNLYKKTPRPRIKNKYPSVTRTIHSRLNKTTNEDNFDLLVKRVNSFKPLKSYSHETEIIKETKNLDNIEPKTQKHLHYKHNTNNPHQVFSNEISSSNAKFLSDLKKIKNTNENKKFDILKKLVGKRKNKLPRMNKRGKTKNYNNENRHKRKYPGHSTEVKEYDKVRHIQPELDIALEQAEKNMKKQHETENKTDLHSILRSLTTSKIEFPTIQRPIKNDNSKPHNNDEFALTILDMNENQGESKTVDSPPHEPSLLLDMDASMYQHMLKQNTQGPNKVSTDFKDHQNNITDILKPTTIVSKQPEQMGTNNENKKETVNQFPKKIETNQNNMNFPLFLNSNVQSEGILADTTNLNTLNLENTIIRQTHYKNDDNSMKIHRPITGKIEPPKIAKKNFDTPLVMNDEEDKSGRKEDNVIDNFSKAEIVLTDSNESDKKSGYGIIATNDQPDQEQSKSEAIKHIKKKKGLRSILRHSRKRIRRRKWLLKCRSACITSYTKVCRRLRCAPKAKKDLKFQCIKRCRSTFGKRKYSSPEK